MPGLEFRQQRVAADQQVSPEGEALVQAGPDSRSPSPVPGIARYTTGDEGIILSFKTAEGEIHEPIGQIESSI